MPSSSTTSGSSDTSSSNGRHKTAAKQGTRGTADSSGDSSGPPAKPGDLPKAGWVTILKRALKEFKHDDITDRAAALTYYGVLAIFPGILVLISVLGLLGKSSTDKILSNLKQVAPGAVASFLNTVITQVQGKAGAAGIAGIIGIALALWSASGYVSGFMNASNAASVCGFTSEVPFTMLKVDSIAPLSSTSRTSCGAALPCCQVMTRMLPSRTFFPAPRRR